MGKDNRLIERGKCKSEDCDCEEFELNDDTSCKYCGVPQQNIRPYKLKVVLRLSKESSRAYRELQPDWTI